MVCQEYAVNGKRKVLREEYQSMSSSFTICTGVNFVGVVHSQPHLSRRPHEAHSRNDRTACHVTPTNRKGAEAKSERLCPLPPRLYRLRSLLLRLNLFFILSNRSYISVGRTLVNKDISPFSSFRTALMFPQIPSSTSPVSNRTSIPGNSSSAFKAFYLWNHQFL